MSHVKKQKQKIGVYRLEILITIILETVRWLETKYLINDFWLYRVTF